MKRLFLPPTWIIASLGDVSHVEQGQSPPGDTYNEAGDGLPFFQGKAEFGETHPVPSKWCNKPQKLAKPEDVLISIRAPVGPTNLADQDCCIGRGLAAVRPIGGMHSKYLLYFLRHSANRLAAQATGTTFKAIGGATLRAHRVVVAPLSEQTRIVEAIESYFTRLDNAVATLERVQANLKRYRASVLKAAVEGRLVPTEAELARQEGRVYEPASELLKRILAERRRRWEEAELAALKAKGKAPKDDKWKAKYKKPVAPDSSQLAELPEGWCWATMGQLCRVQGGFAFKSTDYSEIGIPLVRISNISDGVVDVLPNNPRIPEKIASGMTAFHLQSGDILIAMSGATTGKLGRYSGRERALLNQRVGRFLPHEPDLVEPGYMFILAAVIGTNALSRSYGAAQPNISPGEIEETPVPIAPYSEQIRIATATARHTSISDNIEASLYATSTRTKRLRQSILKWAFEGKLADQDPNDEPASALLERIQAERETKTAKTGKKRNGRKRSAA